MNKHTPGPWRVDETKALGAYGVWTEYATHPGDDGAGYPSKICSVLQGGDRRISREQRDANAALIAAAPDLLEACRKILAWGVRANAFVEPEDGYLVDCLRAAIAKAKGGAA